ncbi:transglutaminase family protein [Kitasatospora sp. GP82]|uniref:transglutaminase-like domain-containing protein n=1 Tax=Kitasatospora sp. GP82 TaxID=3035089 RepID=UPI002475E5DE|nr:transglutaminase family protein [Kitasatospora sp. GP82]MDH6130457.1 transglutaminase-like putative cysteine protease [Kitasatospora sp. GP82]
MNTEPVGLLPASDEPNDYLAADDVIDHGHPEIRALAGRLRRSSPEATARTAFEYVRDEIAHSGDVQEWSAAYRASDVLVRRNAICHGKAHLLAAVLRAQGIRAGLCYQRLNVLHGLVAVHWPAREGGAAGRWVRLDPRGNKPGVDAGFATVPGEERLAWAVDPAAGEFDCPTVYPSTPPVLLRALAEARPGVQGYGHPPLEL